VSHRKPTSQLGAATDATTLTDRLTEDCSGAVLAGYVWHDGGPP